MLFLLFLFTGAAVLLIKNNNTLKNKTLPLFNNYYKALDTKVRKKNQENVNDSQVKMEQHINGYLWQQQPEKNNTSNKYFKPKATIDKKTMLSVTTNSSYKKDDLFKTYNDLLYEISIITFRTS
jgi:hypothetical protein